VSTRHGTGCVIESYGRRVVVSLSGGEVATCKLRGRKLDVVAGDEVRVEHHDGADDWAVVERLPRRNLLLRSDSRGLEEAIASNLDQLGVVVAAVPACDPYIVDRYVAGACYAGITPLLIVNKTDLPAVDSGLAYVEPLRALGFPVCFVSARTGAGLSELIEALRGKRTLLAGQSGVGKSSLLNSLAGDALRAIGRLSVRSGEGRHTTVSSAIVRMPWGELADSPGVRDYAPPPVPLKEVQRGFPEILAHSGGCRFLDCVHSREPNCAVQQAVENGTIDPRRYESYRRLLNLTRQLDEKRGWRA
jgi:ribosome biogenesis GTPase / thiamine phosphate phosphatase